MKYIVIVNRLYYKGNPLVVPAYYHEAATNLAESTENGPKSGFLSTGNIKAVISDSVESAAEQLGKDIGVKLNSWYGRWKFTEKDFEFSILFEEIKDNRFWLIPCSSYGGCYPVIF